MYHKMHYTKRVCKHWLCSNASHQQMKTSEPDDGGGSSHKEWVAPKVILNYEL
jgi:hypothetical protein